MPCNRSSSEQKFHLALCSHSLHLLQHTHTSEKDIMTIGAKVWTYWPATDMHAKSFTAHRWSTCMCGVSSALQATSGCPRSQLLCSCLVSYRAALRRYLGVVDAS